MRVTSKTEPLVVFRYIHHGQSPFCYFELGEASLLYLGSFSASTFLSSRNCTICTEQTGGAAKGFLTTMCFATKLLFKCPSHMKPYYGITMTKSDFHSSYLLISCVVCFRRFSALSASFCSLRGAAQDSVS